MLGRSPSLSDLVNDFVTVSDVVARLRRLSPNPPPGSPDHLVSRLTGIGVARRAKRSDVRDALGGCLCAMFDNAGLFSAPPSLSDLINDQLSIEDVRDHLRARGHRLSPSDFSLLRSIGMRSEAAFSDSHAFIECFDPVEHGSRSPCD